MVGLITQLITIFAPPILKAVQDHFDATGKVPTLAELLALLAGNADRYLSEFAGWRADHPNA